jgi:hypothetical protein
MSCLRARFPCFDSRVPAARGLPADGEGEGQWTKGRVPEEDSSHPPRAAPGSQRLPWDKSSISSRTACPPGAGGWDGERASAKAAGGDSRRGGTTNATAKIRNAGRRCDAGRRPSVNRSAAPALKGVGSMPRRNGSDAGGRQAWRRPWRKVRSRRVPPRSLRVVTQQKNIRTFFATGPVVTSRCGNPPVRPPRTAATTAARP